MKQIPYALFCLYRITLMTSCGNTTSKEKRSNKQQKPNVINIFADDLSIGNLRFYEADNVNTPNIADRQGKAYNLRIHY